MCSHVNYRHKQHFLFSQTFNTNSTSRNTVQVAHCRWLSVMFGTLDFCVLRENILVNPQSSSARWAGQMLLLLVLLMIKEGTERARGFRQVSQLISPGTELKTLQLLPRASFFPPSHSPVIYPSRIYSVSVLSHLSMCVYTCMCFLAFMCGSCYLYTSPQGPCMCPGLASPGTSRRNPQLGSQLSCYSCHWASAHFLEPPQGRQAAFVSGTDPQAVGTERKSKPAMPQQ